MIEFHRGVDRGAILELLGAVGYRSQPTRIERQHEDPLPQLLDDRSYAFQKATQ